MVKVLASGQCGPGSIPVQSKRWSTTLTILQSGDPEVLFPSRVNWKDYVVSKYNSLYCSKALCLILAAVCNNLLLHTPLQHLTHEQSARCLGGALWSKLLTALARSKLPLQGSGSGICFWPVRPRFDAGVEVGVTLTILQNTMIYFGQHEQITHVVLF